jgi:hypothetical protein
MPIHTSMLLYRICCNTQVGAKACADVGGEGVVGGGEEGVGEGEEGEEEEGVGKEMPPQPSTLFYRSITKSLAIP